MGRRKSYVCTAWVKWYTRTTPRYSELIPHFPQNLGARAIIRVRLTRVSDSCGYAVPLLDFVAPRDLLDHWADKKGPEGLAAYREKE